MLTACLFGLTTLNLDPVEFSVSIDGNIAVEFHQELQDHNSVMGVVCGGKRPLCVIEKTGTKFPDCGIGGNRLPLQSLENRLTSAPGIRPPFGFKAGIGSLDSGEPCNPGR